MNPLRRLTESAIGSAARRWPAAVREELAVEWHAELHALRHDPTLPWPRRTWQQVAYALSLALSPSPRPGRDPVPWRAAMAAGLRRSVARLALLAGVALIAIVFSAKAPDLWLALLRHVPDRYAGVLDTAIPVASQVIAAAALAWFGAYVGRSATANSIALATTAGLLGAGVYLMYEINRQSDPFGDPNYPLVPRDGPAMVVWAVVAAATAITAARLIRAGHQRAGRLAGIAGMLAALDVSGAVAAWSPAALLHVGAASSPLWFPATVLGTDALGFGPNYPHGGEITFGYRSVSTSAAFHASDMFVPNLRSVCLPLLLCTAFLLAYTLQAAVQAEFRQIGQRPAAAGIATTGW